MSDKSRTELSEKVPLYRMDYNGAIYYVAAQSVAVAIVNLKVCVEETGDYDPEDFDIEVTQLSVSDALEGRVYDEEIDSGGESLFNAMIKHRETPVRNGVLCCTEWP